MSVLLVGLFVLAGCSGDDAGDAESFDDAEGAVGEETAQVPDGAEVAPEVDSDDDRAASAQVGALGEATGDQLLVREGSVTIRYRDTFDSAYAQVAAIASGLGGAVAAVSSERAEEEVTGAVTVEVPVEAYDQLLSEVAEVGEILRRDIRSREVTTEHVDLSSRLRHLERQEAFYLDLFDDAAGVEDALAIQGHLEEVQARKEQVQGRLDQLERMAATSTLAVQLVGEGSEPELAGPQGGSFSAYWDDAVTAFVQVSGTILVLVVGSAPLVLSGMVVLAVILVVIRVWQRSRPPA